MWADGSYNIYVTRDMKACCDLSEGAACYHNNMLLPSFPRRSGRVIDNSSRMNKNFLYST